MRKTPVLFVILAVLLVMIPPAVLSSSHGDDKKSTAGKVTPAMLAQGKAVYEKNCVACHGAGVAGAPKFGDKVAWKEHIAHGLEHMAEIAIRGAGAMPPRGGNPGLGDAEVRAAVAYIMENSR
jgi:cytochrome c5